MRKILVGLAGIIVVGIALGAVVLAGVEARNDRVWADYLTYTATTTVDTSGVVRIHHVRDYTYTDGAIVGRDWLDEVAIDPKRIVQMWFVLEPFAQWEAVGHTFLTFEFDDGSAYSFSVEARMEEGEKYSAIHGFSRTYELAYTWGTERDFLTRRLLYLGHPVRMYPLTVNKEDAQSFFKLLLARTNDLAEHPRWYNTFTANCTNLLAELANDVAPDSVPWDISWHLPGYSDRFLMRIRYIATEGTVEQTQEMYDLTSRRADVEAIATSTTPAIFSVRVREMLPER